MALISEITNNKNQIRQWRHYLHKIPEIAFQEYKTAQFVEQKLNSFGLKVYSRMAGTGVIASLSAGDNNKAIALRADMDALPVLEKNNIDYCSTHKGMMHACGHDGHTSMLLGAAFYLSQHLNFNGTVYFVFQPAEENEGGARKLVEEGFFNKFPVKAIYGMHNWPGLDVGKFAVRSGVVMAAYDAFDITITGKGGHAAAPHDTVDPIVIASIVITALQNITSRQINPLDSVVLSITKIRAGDSYNVIPESAFLSGTVRTFHQHIQKNVMAQLKQIVRSICKAYGAKAKVDYQKRYPATINNQLETENAFNAAVDVVGKNNIISDNPPSLGSEDFSLLLNECRGCFVSIGNGSGASLHNPLYDFNDDILVIGASYWARLTQMQLR